VGLVRVIRVTHKATSWLLMRWKRVYQALDLATPLLKHTMHEFRLPAAEVCNERFSGTGGSYTARRLHAIRVTP